MARANPPIRKGLFVNSAVRYGRHAAPERSRDSRSTRALRGQLIMQSIVQRSDADQLSVIEKPLLSSTLDQTSERYMRLL